MHHYSIYSCCLRDFLDFVVDLSINDNNFCNDCSYNVFLQSMHLHYGVHNCPPL
jgi:hypothetical protein